MGWILLLLTRPRNTLDRISAVTQDLQPYTRCIQPIRAVSESRKDDTSAAR